MSTPVIKVCGMTDPANISAVAKLEPEYMGFIFYPASKRFIGTSPQAATSTGKLHLSTFATGVFVDAMLDEIETAISQLNLDAVQLHGEDSPDFCRQVRSLGVDVIKAFGVDHDFNFAVTKPYRGIADYFLFDTKTALKGGSGIRFDWKKLKEYTGTTRYFLSGGIGPEHLDELRTLNDRRFYGVDLNSRFETAPGIKDIEQLTRAFRMLRKPLEIEQ